MSVLGLIMFSSPYLKSTAGGDPYTNFIRTKKSSILTLGRFTQGIGL